MRLLWNPHSIVASTVVRDCTFFWATRDEMVIIWGNTERRQGTGPYQRRDFGQWRERAKLGQGRPRTILQSFYIGPDSPGPLEIRSQFPTKQDPIYQMTFRSDIIPPECWVDRPAYLQAGVLI